MGINWRSTKFLQAAFVQLSSALFLYIDKIGPGEYVTLSTLALAIYGAADVAHKRSVPPSA